MISFWNGVILVEQLNLVDLIYKDDLSLFFSQSDSDMVIKDKSMTEGQDVLYFQQGYINICLYVIVHKHKTHIDVQNGGNYIYFNVFHHIQPNP